MKKRLLPRIRKDRILRAAVDAAIDLGFHKVTRQAVADQAGVTASLINHYYSTMPKLRRAVMRYAVKNRVLEILRVGLAIGDKQAYKASAELQTEALLAQTKDPS